MRVSEGFPVVNKMNSLSFLRRRTAPLAAAALLALVLALAAAGGAAAAEENVIEFPLNQAIPGSQKLREVSQTSQSRNELSKPSSPGRDPSTGLPNDVPADVAGSAAAADDTANGSGPAPASEGGKKKKKERIIGTLTSLLDPPPDFVMPQLSEEQKNNLPELKKLRQGIATVVYRRAVNNLDAVDMNCGIGYINNHFTAHFAAVGKELYRNGEICGVCIQLWCVDSVCEDTLVRNATFMIVDSCQDCKANNIVVSGLGAANLTGLDIDDNPTTQVAWKFVSCAPLTTGNIKMLPSDRSTASFLGINFSNTKQLIRSVTINGLRMTRTSYGLWVIDTPNKNIDLKPPYELVLVGANRERLIKKLPNLRAQDLDIQFKA